ncbi:MAG: type III pantothenate kinase [Bacteroidales bacterium]
MLIDEFELRGNQLLPVRYSILSSVAKDSSEIEETLVSRTTFFKMNSKLPLPFSLHYKTPETLGNDRIAAVTGGMNMLPGQNLLVIDAGTCITYDFINKKGEYKGGGISPGIYMRFRALHTFTGKLPLVELSENVELIGDSTRKVYIIPGVQYGIIEEVKGICQPV